MKRYIYGKTVFLFLLIVGLNTSCKKSFLEVPDKTAILRQAYVTDLKSTEEYLNGVYMQLTSSFWDGYVMIYPDLIADNIKPVTGSNVMSPHYTWNQQQNSDNGKLLSTALNVNICWLRAYAVIRSCNFIVENVDKYRSENETKADNLKGQALAIRALLHAELVNIFAQSYSFTADGSHPGIPYVTTSDWTEPATRQTVAEVYKNMVSDLNEAIRLLPATQQPVGNWPAAIIMNGNAAKALLARTFLFMGDYTAAKNLAREVIAAVPMLSNANYLLKLFTAQDSEALFQLAPSATNIAGSPGSYTTLFMGVLVTSPNLIFYATDDITFILRENLQDKRANWVKTNNAGKDTIVKYPANVIPGYSLGAGSYYQSLIRSTEMYLTAAEAYAKLNNEDSARVFLNMVRQRANASAILITPTGSALADSIYKERRKEFAFEGLRMFDLQRWKKSVNRIEAPNPSAKNLPYPSEKAIAPIPFIDTQSGVPQNPGY